MRTAAALIRAPWSHALERRPSWQEMEPSHDLRGSLLLSDQSLRGLGVISHVKLTIPTKLKKFLPVDRHLRFSFYLALGISFYTNHMERHLS